MCGCDTPTNASVSNGFVVVYVGRFAQQFCCVYSDSHQANGNAEKGRIRQRIRRPGRQPGSPEESAAWMFDNLRVDAIETRWNATRHDAPSHYARPNRRRVANVARCPAWNCPALSEWSTMASNPS